MSVELFPYDDIRDVQDELISAISSVVSLGKNLIVHAPTGLGKTAASIAPILAHTLNTGKTIFFLTSMHTQHLIAMNTVKDINDKHNKQVLCVDIVGKKHMCLQQGIDSMSSRDFLDFCKLLREDNKCEFYSRFKSGEELSFESKKVVDDLKKSSPVSTQKLINSSSLVGVCPYEVSLIVGSKADVVVADYYYLFHPHIRDSFLKKMNKELQDCVIVVDEAHNLPSRIRDLASSHLSNIVLKRAFNEAEDVNNRELKDFIKRMMIVLQDYKLLCKGKDEIYVSRLDFISRVEKLFNYNEIVDLLDEYADVIRKEKRSSYLGALASFLSSWLDESDGFTRIFSVNDKDILMLSKKCLDPGLVSGPVVNNASSVILMSGTLTPTHMYREILGFDKAEELVLNSPFPVENKLSLVIPKTSTKFTTRGDLQYKQIADVVVEIVNGVPGNSAVFFPSFRFRDDVYNFFRNCEKTVFVESPGMSKDEKEDMLNRFKAYKDKGAVLLGAISGSFGEGIDLPGDYLKCVVVVGLPLQKPDLESKALIEYYDRKFAKGWDYGYLFPAFNKTLQSAGRCIRSETDKGVIVFLDERYAWPMYERCFPRDWNIKKTLDYGKYIKDFFS